MPEHLKNIALSGPSGSGKSSLAQYVSDHVRDRKGCFIFNPCESVAASVFERYGYKQSDKMSARERLFLQNHILDAQITEYENTKERIIADRSPMDMATYMMCDDHLVREGLLAEATAYSRRCAQVTKRFFPRLAVIPLCIPYEEISKRPPYDIRYIKAWTCRLLHLLNVNSVPFVVMPEIDGVKKRAAWMADEFKFRLYLQE